MPIRTSFRINIFNSEPHSTNTWGLYEVKVVSLIRASVVRGLYVESAMRQYSSNDPHYTTTMSSDGFGEWERFAL